jgi:hypothetical protein
MRRLRYVQLQAFYAITMFLVLHSLLNLVFFLYYPQALFPEEAREGGELS